MKADARLAYGHVPPLPDDGPLPWRRSVHGLRAQPQLPAPLQAREPVESKARTLGLVLVAALASYRGKQEVVGFGFEGFFEDHFAADLVAFAGRLGAPKPSGRPGTPLQ